VCVLGEEGRSTQKSRHSDLRCNNENVMLLHCRTNDNALLRPMNQHVVHECHVEYVGREPVILKITEKVQQVCVCVCVWVRRCVCVCVCVGRCVCVCVCGC